MRKKTIIAIVYDFDGTLAKGNIQENSFIPNLGLSNEDFWKDVKELAKDKKMDEILAYMYMLVSKATPDNNVKVDRKSFQEHGKKVGYFKGVENYFGLIKEYANNKNIQLKHYIISSGTKEMIEGTSIAKNFNQIYASSFMYDQHDVAIWPAIAINYTTKTQFLFRINKGIEDEWSNDKINKFISEQERPVPFNHMIYLGDGETDIPAMKMVNYQGGTSIAVYPPSKRGAREKADNLLKERRATYVAPANYEENSELYKIITKTLDAISAKDCIKSFSVPKN